MNDTYDWSNNSSIMDCMSKIYSLVKFVSDTERSMDTIMEFVEEILEHEKTIIESDSKRNNGSKLKYEYKGYVWRTDEELSSIMGKTPGAISHWKKRHPNKTTEDYIDLFAQEPLMYKGFIWVSDEDLSIKIGKSINTISMWKKRHPNKTTEDYIDEIILSNGKIMHTYGEYTWTSDRDLSRKLGKSLQCIYNWKRTHIGKTTEDYIDEVVLKKEK